MNTDKEIKEQKEQKKEEEQIRIPQFDDLQSSYIFWRNFLPKTPYEECLAKIKCVSIGKELLKDDKENNEEIQEIYEKACTALIDAKPKKRNIIFHHYDMAGVKFPIYRLSAEDAGNCQAETERLDEVRMDFKNQQYEHIVGELQEVDDEIFHVLVKYSIIKKHRPTVKDILDKKIEERYLKELNQ